MSRNILIAALALGSAVASAQSVNTQVNGLVLTNGLGSVSDSSALGSNQYVSTGVSYLTDGDTSTFAFNLGNALGNGNSGTGSLQGNFSGTISSSATGIYIVGVAANYPGEGTILYNGPSFSVQLALLGGLSSAHTYGDANFTITSQEINPLSFYFTSPHAFVSVGINPAVEYYYAYLYIPFSDFSATYDQVVGIKLGNFTYQYPDISYIGVGYAGAYSGGGGAVPEPSTYGLALGGLALVGAVIRRRRSK